MVFRNEVGLLLVIVSIFPGSTYSEVLLPERTFSLAGNTQHLNQLSGVAFHGKSLIACPDEGTKFVLFANADPNQYELVRAIKLPPDGDGEMDMEGVASDVAHAYIVGSHSLRRKKLNPKDTYESNRALLTNVKPHDASYSLFRLTLTEDGKLVSEEHISLKEIIAEDAVLRPFDDIPSKENGVDIEGIAVKDKMIFVGLRGPILRDNYVPVLSFNFDKPQDYDLQFVQLDGRGIRDLAAVDSGFLLIAGPVGDGDGSHCLYFWNGADCISGTSRPESFVVKVGEFKATDDNAPEGLAIESETASEWHTMVVFDGSPKIAKFVIEKPDELMKADEVSSRRRRSLDP